MQNETLMQNPKGERISKLDIEEFVHNATWRELLMELVETRKLDPWDIDISEMLDGYIDVIREMKVLDLRVPANIILAASILLRMKSETLYILSQQEEAAGEEPEGLLHMERPIVDVPNLVNKARAQPHRKITLEELIDALDSAMKTEDRRKAHIEELQIPLNIAIGNDIDKRTDTVYSLIKTDSDRLGMTTFSILARHFHTVEEKLLDLFVPLLFLAQSENVSLMQEEFFQEIIIKLAGEKHGKAPAKE